MGRRLNNATHGMTEYFLTILNTHKDKDGFILESTLIDDTDQQLVKDLTADLTTKHKVDCTPANIAFNKDTNLWERKFQIGPFSSRIYLIRFLADWRNTFVNYNYNSNNDKHQMEQWADQTGCNLFFCVGNNKISSTDLYSRLKIGKIQNPYSNKNDMRSVNAWINHSLFNEMQSLDK